MLGDVLIALCGTRSDGPQLLNRLFAPYAACSAASLLLVAKYYDDLQ